MAQDAKTVNGLAIASVKSWDGLAIASVKTIQGVDNTGGPSEVSDDFAGMTSSDSLADRTGWTVPTGSFQGGTDDVTSDTNGIVNSAYFVPAGFTTAVDHTVLVSCTTGGASNAQGAACAVQADGACYHVYADAAGTVFFGIADGSGSGSDYLSTAAAIVASFDVQISVTGVGSARRVTASYDIGGGMVTPSGWANRDFGTYLDGGDGGIAGFSDAGNTFVTEITVTNN